MPEHSPFSRTYGLTLDDEDSYGPTFDSLAEASFAAVDAVGPQGKHDTAVILILELVDRADRPTKEILNARPLARVYRVNEDGAATRNGLPLI
ncbi:MAG: hypothetical protein M3Q31_05635 [Actinomycetota bacterium]|nr:hypothetical protein [Actinomycetota bacterium]